MPRSAVVVGAGVGGVAAVGALSAAGVHVTWIDPSFTVGAFANYRDVPANTKVSLLVPHLENLVPQGIPDGPARAALVALRKGAFSLPGLLPSDPDAGLGWCGLDAVADVVSAMSQTAFPAVTRIVGKVLVLSAVAESGGWLGQYEGQHESEPSRRAEGETRRVGELRVDSVVMSTGCVAVAAPSAVLPSHWAMPCDAVRAPAVRVIPLEEALQADCLREHLRMAGGGGVGVVGGGHSGMVMVRALLALASVPYVRLFVRRPIQLAQWSEAEGRYGAWGFRGLKGAAAELALTRGLVGTEPTDGPVSDGDGRLELWDVAALTTDPRATAGLRSVVYSVGYTRGPLPTIVTIGGAAACVTGCDPATGALLASPGPLPGLYGAGLAFAEDENSSGAPYPEASLKAFAARARAIVADVTARPGED